MPKLYRTVIEGTVAGEGWANVLHFEDVGPEQGAEALCNHLANNWVTGHIAFAATSLRVTKITAVEVVRLGLQDAFELPQNAFNGGTTGPNSDPQLALKVNIRTGRYGRSYRGRFFLAGIDDQRVANGRLDFTGTTQVNAWITTISPMYLGESPTSGFRLGVFSREKYKLISNPFDDYWAGGVSLASATVMSTMRSRKPIG